jgi:hypothetical protein
MLEDQTLLTLLNMVLIPLDQKQTKQLVSQEQMNALSCALQVILFDYNLKLAHYIYIIYISYI